jgi:hypothetical protein
VKAQATPDCQRQFETDTHRSSQSLRYYTLFTKARTKAYGGEAGDESCGLRGEG